MDDNRVSVRQILAECLDGAVGQENIRPEMRIIEDLHFDSIVYIQFVVMVEETFGIQIPDDKLSYDLYECYVDIEDMVIACLNAETEMEGP